MKRSAQLLAGSFFVSAVVASPGVAPYRQPAGKLNGGAIRGVLGDCEKDLGLYYGYVEKGEPYHCNMAAAEHAFKQKYYPDEDLCDWGFGELIPAPQEVAGKYVWGPPGEEWRDAPGVAPGTRDPADMFTGYMCATRHALLGGDTEGAIAYRQMCQQGSQQFCSPQFRNLTLQWPSSMAVYRITEKMAGFMSMWRQVYHRPNIAFGDRNKYYAGWVRKVVRCTDIPQSLLGLEGQFVQAERLMPGSSTESTLEVATRTWLGLTSLLTAGNLTPSFTDPPDWEPGPVQKVVPPTLKVSLRAGGATVTVSGADGRWFGIGFNASTMAERPRAVIVDGRGAVTERALAAYTFGEEVSPEFKEVSSTLENGTRTAVLNHRGLNRSALSFRGGALRCIWAVGIGPDYAAHERSGPATLAIEGAGEALLVV